MGRSDLIPFSGQQRGQQLARQVTVVNDQNAKMGFFGRH
jgi:hypothetical protein